MLQNAAFKFSPKDKLILTNNTISLECKTWTILHSLLVKDDQLLEQLENAQDYHWEPTEGNPTLSEESPYFFKTKWYNPNERETYKKRGKFYRLLTFHADSIYDSDFFYVERFENMGLGLCTRTDNTVINIADHIPGYLEYIDEALFELLTVVGHKSLYRYKDIDNNIQRCILYGPLSLVNSKPNIPVGFMNCDPIRHEELYYEFTTTIRYSYVTFPDREGSYRLRSHNVSSLIYDTDVNEVYNTARSTTDYTHPEHTKILTTTELVARVKMCWTGTAQQNTHHNVIPADEQIFINYRYSEIPEVEYVDLTISDDEDDEQDEEED